MFSNAVVEHVGSRARRRRSSANCAVSAERSSSRRPNRWFPFEHHTGLPLLHYLPASVFRALLRQTRYATGRSESNLNILTGSRVERRVSADVTPTMRVIRLMGVPSNLVASCRIAR